MRLQVSIHSRLLTMASQRRYNQPNIAMGVTAVYPNKISLAFHERRCGVTTSSDKTDGQEPSEDGTKGQGPWLSFAADFAGSSENLRCASALRRIADLPSASSCLIWLITAPVLIGTLSKWVRLPWWRAVELPSRLSPGTPPFHEGRELPPFVDEGHNVQRAMRLAM